MKTVKRERLGRTRPTTRRPPVRLEGIEEWLDSWRTHFFGFSIYPPIVHHHHHRNDHDSPHKSQVAVEQHQRILKVAGYFAIFDRRNETTTRQGWHTMSLACGEPSGCVFEAHQIETPIDKLKRDEWEQREKVNESISKSRTHLLYPPPHRPPAVGR